MTPKELADFLATEWQTGEPIRIRLKLTPEEARKAFPEGMYMSTGK